MVEWCYCLERKSVISFFYAPPLRVTLAALAVRQGGWIFYCQVNLFSAMRGKFEAVFHAYISCVESYLNANNFHTFSNKMRCRVA